MSSDILSYGLLAAIFVVTGLRMLVQKPNRMTEIPISRNKKREKNSTN
jgi:hypothetical protein